ncbi:MAG: SDR family oxidoreductase [Myxococcota bacterium]
MAGKRRSVVITGASSGIGRAAAEALIAEGFHVFGSVRTQEDAEALRRALGSSVTPLLFDVTSREGIADAVTTVREAIGSTTLSGLVNNAGVAVPGPLMHLDLDELRGQFEINVIGLLAVTQAFLPLLGASRNPPGAPGRIVNISSMSGRMVVPFLGAYAASKHAVEAMSDALRCELMVYGIDVLLIEPGSIKTSIWDKAEAADLSPYDGTDYADILKRFRANAVQAGRNSLETSHVTGPIVEALTSDKPRTRYPLPNNVWMGWRIPRLMPDRWADRMVTQRLGLRRFRR